MRWVWFTVLVTAAVGAVTLARGRARKDRPEVGAVSDEWIAQHKGVES